MDEQDQNWQEQRGSPLLTEKTVQLKYKVIFTLHFKDLRKRASAYWVFFLGAQQHSLEQASRGGTSSRNKPRRQSLVITDDEGMKDKSLD